MSAEIIEMINELRSRIDSLQQALIEERKLSFDLAKEIERLNRIIAENNDKDDGK